MTSLEAGRGTNPPEDDSDLADLLSPQSPTRPGTRSYDETKSLKSALDGVASTKQRQRVGLVDFLIAYIGLMIMNRPKLILVSVFLFFLALAAIVNSTLSNVSVGSIYPIIDTDYSGVTSKYDLSVGKIDHWCLSGGDENCRCEDPLKPTEKMHYRNWVKAHSMNTASIDDKIHKSDNQEEKDDDEDTSTENDIDVLFIGENIVEAWAGRAVSFNNTSLMQIKDSFDKHFNKAKGGKYDGLALGIAGDSAPNVLWRIQNGELPEELNPQVIWLFLGTNDLAMKQCSEEVVLLGILRVIEEIQSLKPNAKIIVNSILPMTSDQKGRVPPITNKQRRKRIKRKPSDFRRLDVLETSEKEEKDIKAPAVTIRKRGPFFSVRISMWPSVAAINTELKRFCKNHKKMVFFDAYNVFVEKAEDRMFPQINKDLMRSMAIGIPSLKGHEELHKAILRKLDFTLKKKQVRDNNLEKENKALMDKMEENYDETELTAASHDDTEENGKAATKSFKKKPVRDNNLEKENKAQMDEKVDENYDETELTAASHDDAEEKGKEATKDEQPAKMKSERNVETEQNDEQDSE